jgi:hypothetical protein
MDLILFVKPGQRITAALWNRLAAAARACRILSGDGIRIRTTPDGTLISCSALEPWKHPFKVALSGTTASQKGATSVATTSAAPARRRLAGLTHWALGLLCLGLGLVVAWAFVDALSGADPERLAGQVLARIGESGVSNPVTAVLLNFRGYDTLLELAVLLAALLGILALGP